VLLAALSACVAPAVAPPRPLRPDSLEHNGGERDCDLLHVDLRLAVDLEAGAIGGQVVNRVRGLAGGTGRLRFHAVDLEISSVHDGQGGALVWECAPPFLDVELPERLAAGEELEVWIEFRGEPEDGLHFVETSKDAPAPSPQAWSQGQLEDNRHWIPTWDFPNDRATFRGSFRVGPGLVALSNGRLVETEEHPGGDRSFHWELEQRIPTYLIAVAVGQWEHYGDDWNGLPVDYWVGPGTGEEKARRAFGETPAMLEYFSELLGVPYPYAKYAQVAVADFLYGGMENASITIQNDDVIGTPQEDAENDNWTRLLVAHELAHQWFGNLVTCLGWSHLWLNEAWASYLELRWEREVAGEASFRLWLERYRETYLEGGRTLYPLSEDWRTQLSAGRCSNEYEKGPWVLHMLCEELGEVRFWAATRAYLTRHADDLVTTADFARAFFDTTGRNVEGFLEQWVEGAGHPAYRVRLDERGSGEERELAVRVRQVQETSELVPLFDVGVVCELEDASGVTRHLLRVDDEEERFAFPLSGELLDFRFDTPCRVLCELDLEKAPRHWVRQARGASAPLRWRALAELDEARRRGSAEAREALFEIAASDPEVLLRRRAREFLTRSEDLPVLVNLLEGEVDPLARLELLEALAARQLAPELALALAREFAGVESERVRAALERLGFAAGRVE